MKTDLTGRHALVTGAGSGIGRHVARIIAAEGATVVVCGRRLDKLQDTVAAIAAAGGRAAAVVMDLGDGTSIAAGIAAAESKFGAIDLLVNNAGVIGQDSIVDMPEDKWDQILDTNLKGGWLCAREVARRLIAANKPGVVINIASMLGLMVQKGTGPYSASKAGLIHLTRAMASEWARHGIRVNAIAPGYVTTEMTDDYLTSERGKKLIAAIPQRRAGVAEDLTGVVLLLASDASSYITGSVLTVDGGISLGTL